MKEDLTIEYSSMKILVVDDDKNTLILMNHILNNRYIVETVGNSKDVIEKVELFRPDLILMDIMMPGISGLDLCRELKLHPDFISLPIILITAKVDETDVYQGLEAGAIDYIKKPFSEIELIARINSALKVEIYIRKLKMLNKLKDSFLSMVSHDIRTPLTAIMGFSELLLDDRVDGKLSDRHRQIIAQILDSANHQNRIIKDLLNLSIIESGGMKLLIDRHRLIDIIDKTINDVNFISNQKNISIEVSVNDQCFVFCDSDRISQVLTNLLVNAIKFTPETGVVEIGVSASNKDYVEVFVRDTGVGILNENINKIFDEYEMFTTKGTDGEKGTGLGVTICNKIIKEHGGTMFVQSEEGKGSTFYFTLPNIKKL